MLIPNAARKSFIVGALLGLSSCSTAWQAYNESRPSGSNEYWNKVETAGAIETSYMRLGPHQVMTYEQPAEGSLGRYRAWYPADMKGGATRYPVIVSNNGTGVGAAKYEQWFRHMASWGFIVIGNEEGTSWNGKSAEQTLSWLLASEKSPDSVFHNHLDRSKIGLIGHSQGGTGVVNAATVQPSARLYKTAVLLASTHNGYNAFLRWTSDAAELSIPTLVLVAKDDGLTSPESLTKLYDSIPRGVFKAKARRTGVGHGDMLVVADGYVTAWMMWQLKGDRNASRAFVGAGPELATNKNFIDVEIAQP